LATALNLDIAGLLALPNLSDILTYHVLGTTVNAAAIVNGQVVQPVSTTNTLKLTLTSAGNVYVNHAQVTAADLTADNGVVHVINNVVLPSETVVDIALDNGFTTLVAALIQELVPALCNPLADFTVFAPTNDAFDDLADEVGVPLSAILGIPELPEILLYHVLGANVPSTAVTNGAIIQPLSTLNTLKLTQTTSGDIFVNQAEVTSADINSSNGVVHVIDAVLLPIGTVVDLAIDNNFSTLTAAVVKAELVPALSDPFSEYTVFAPTNAAFDNLATALGTNLNGILNLPNLQDILLYHVLDGIVQSTSLVAGPVETLNGSDVIVSLTSGVKINDANVILADVEADNGIVHVLDKVLLEDFLNLDAEIFKELSVSPNPATDFIAIENVVGLSYQLMDISGKVILSGTTQMQNQINIADLNAGIYNIRFEKDGTVKAIKVLKM
jgi:transforming growth factor-beta-induced protein